MSHWTPDPKGKQWFDAGTPAERMGSEEDPRRFCLVITIKSLNKCQTDCFSDSACVLEFKFKDVTLSVEDVLFDCSNH